MTRTAPSLSAAPATRSSGPVPFPAATPAQTGAGFSEFGGNASGGSAVNAEPVDPELPATPVVDTKTTVIAENATWKGKLQSDGAVHVHGHFKGAVPRDRRHLRG